ncbi:MAG: hypothetical protein ACFCUG_05980 [Thiotrichales bacterium]
MSEPQHTGVLLTPSNLNRFFHESVQNALTHQHVDARADTTRYLAELLTQYAHADRFFDHTEHGLQLRALAQLYADAVAAPGERERHLFLRRLGDVALFVSGLFSGMLARKPVGVDYYVAMGRSAYASLSTPANGPDGEAGAPVFDELARNFVRFADVFAEVAERAPWTANHDLMQLWQLWQQTGSPRLERKLRALGVTPLRPCYAG